jgi:uncharacterized protein (TIGR02186 family)
MKRALALAALLAALPTTAGSDELVSGLSQDLIEITSNYTGTDIVVFGAIESNATPQTPANHDIVVVVRGPDTDMIVRRKARVAGVWANRDRITLSGMPSYYFIASSRPLAQIASPQSLQRYQLGLDNIVPKRESTHVYAKGEPFRHAVIRERMRDGLYASKANGVEFLSYSLFRVRVPVPAGVARGQYTAEVYLFSDGTVVSAQSTPLFVDQTGIERRIYNFAHEWPLAYGFATVLMAMALGWLSSALFRQR